MFSFFNSSDWAGLFTLIFLEIILSIDNVIFIAILSKKLPKNQRKKARYTGLLLALFMRFGLLFVTSWLVNLTKPILVNKFFSFSTKEIILLTGGLFLFIKATLELYHHIHDVVKKKKKKQIKANFWYVVAQIVILDAIFSIDSVMTAVGMIHNNLLIMISAITIATILMIFLSHIFVKFINSQKTMIVLCLSLLLMISLNLIIESLGFYIPKEYFYTSIVFSLFIEILNQIRKKKLLKQKLAKSLTTQITNSILNIININEKNNKYEKKELFTIDNFYNKKTYIDNRIKINTIQMDQVKIVINALQLHNSSISDIMIPAKKIIWININSNYKNIKAIAKKTSYNMLPICKNRLNNIIGVVPIKTLLSIIKKNQDIHVFSTKYPPIIIPDSLNIIHILALLRFSNKKIIFVINELGKIQGLITPTSILKKIIGYSLNNHNVPTIIRNNNNWIATGSTRIDSLQKILHINFSKIVNQNNCFSLADFLIYKYKNIPKIGKIIYQQPYQFHILQSNSYQIHLVKIKRDKRK